jgi:hypothetical protein
MQFLLMYGGDVRPVSFCGQWYQHEVLRFVRRLPELFCRAWQAGHRWPVSVRRRNDKLCGPGPDGSRARIPSVLKACGPTRKTRKHFPRGPEPCCRRH